MCSGTSIEVGPATSVYFYDISSATYILVSGQSIRVVRLAGFVLKNRFIEGISISLGGLLSLCSIFIGIILSSSAGRSLAKLLVAFSNSLLSIGPSYVNVSVKWSGSQRFTLDASVVLPAPEGP